jgi:hypothetical protein
MSKAEPLRFYNLKEFADFSQAHGIDTNHRKLSVYRKRGKLPEPSAYVGNKAGWTKEQIDSWIEEYKNTHPR